MSGAKLAVGDVVFVNTQGHHCSNKTGVVKQLQPGNNEAIGVEFNEDIPGCNNLGGLLTVNRGFYLSPRQLVKMLPLSSVLKNNKTKQRKTITPSEPVFIIEDD